MICRAVQCCARGEKQNHHPFTLVTLAPWGLLHTPSAGTQKTCRAAAWPWVPHSAVLELAPVVSFSGDLRVSPEWVLCPMPALQDQCGSKGGRVQ